ncbi:MAG: dihydrofolate reductase, partial [Bacteroidota bacterium]
TTLMGNGTYRLVQSFDVPFPYPDKTNYVFTKDSSLTKDEHVHFVSGDIISFVKELKAQEGKHIWLVGGG